MITYSTVGEVNQGVEEGVDGAISQCEKEIADARKNTPRLKEVVGQIVAKVKKVYPEAKWIFGRGQNSVGWQLDFYSHALSWAINDLIRPLISEANLEGLGLFITSQPLEAVEIEG